MALQAEVVRFHRPLFSYTNHLSGVSLLVALAPTGGRASQTSSLRAVELYLASIYAQAAAAKIIHGGLRWVSHPSTIRAALSELGNPRFQFIIGKRRATQVLAAAALAVEVAVLPSVLFGNSPIRRVAGILMLAFHGGVKAVLNISFWHLWWLLSPQLALSGNRERVGDTGISRVKLAAVAIIAGNWLATILNRNFGPFCSYNMFFGVTPDEYPQLRVRLRRGGTSKPVQDVRGLMPFEFFRTVSMLEHAFVNNDDEASRLDCARAILSGLNDHPWPAGDEITASLRTPNDLPFDGFDLLLMLTSTHSPWQRQVQEHTRVQTIYSYRASGDTAMSIQHTP
jgi:hypothetical protein